MMLYQARVWSTDTKSGLSTPAPPTSAATAVRPRAAFATVATGWPPTRARTTAAAAAVNSRLREMGSHPDEGQRADQEGGGEHPGRPVDLALQPAAGAITPPPPLPASPPPSPQAPRLWRLDHDSRPPDD